MAPTALPYDHATPGAPLPQAVLEVCLCHGVRRTARAVARLYDAALRPAGITAGQFTLLTAVAALQPLPASRLRTVLAMDRTTLSRALKPLDAMGLLAVTGGRGRRPAQLALTGDGERLLRAAAPLWRAAQADATRRIGPARTGLLLGALAAVTAGVGDL